MNLGTDEMFALRLPHRLRCELERVAQEHSSSMSGAARFLMQEGLRQFDAAAAARRGSQVEAQAGGAG